MSGWDRVTERSLWMRRRLSISIATAQRHYDLLCWLVEHGTHVTITESFIIEGTE